MTGGAAETEGRDGAGGRAAADISILAEFIEIFCAGSHAGRDRSPVQGNGRLGDALASHPAALCGECARLLRYAASMRLICPYNPKPSCKKCGTHCYRPAYREAIRRVMRYSGMRLIVRGKLALIKKYFF